MKLNIKVIGDICYYQCHCLNNSKNGMKFVDKKNKQVIQAVVIITGKYLLWYKNGVQFIGVMQEK